MALDVLWSVQVVQIGPAHDLAATRVIVRGAHVVEADPGARLGGQGERTAPGTPQVDQREAKRIEAYGLDTHSDGHPCGIGCASSAPAP